VVHSGVLDEGRPQIAEVAVGGTEDATIHLDLGQQRNLRALATRLGRPQAELIREALAAYLDLHEDFHLPSWVGSWSGGPRTEATSVEPEDRLPRAHYREPTRAGIAG
jgi:hypothetical protein